MFDTHLYLVLQTLAELNAKLLVSNRRALVGRKKGKTPNLKTKSDCDFKKKQIRHLNKKIKYI